MKHSIAIAGAGLAGSTLARMLAENGATVTIYEARSHIAGHCYDARCPQTGIMIHRYGPHIFHTDKQPVWDFLNRFTRFSAYQHRVKTCAQGRIWSLPVNLHTLNQFWNSALSPQQAREKLSTLALLTEEKPVNLQEQALQLMGDDLYQAFFKGYSEKQWGRSALSLPAAILKRLPFRFDYDDRYFRQRWQGIPRQGYTSMIRSMLDHPAITVHLNQPLTHADCHRLRQSGHLFWTGPLDAFFDYEAGRLPYRTLHFEEFITKGDWQGCAVMNYGDASVPWTRITEHKHFMPDEQHELTVCWREYSREAGPGDIPYYPVNLTQSDDLLTHYRQRASALDNVTFIGRLGTFRYQDMDAVVADALQVAQQFMAGCAPIFPEQA